MGDKIEFAIQPASQPRRPNLAGPLGKASQLEDAETLCFHWVFWLFGVAKAKNTLFSLAFLAFWDFWDLEIKIELGIQPANLGIRF